MRTTIKDITTVTKGIIIHQVNCQDKMGSGVAKALYTKWPQVKSQYHEDNKRTGWPKLGGLTKVIINENLIVINSYSQLNYGYDGKKYTDEKLLTKAINKVAQARDAKGSNETIYIPHEIGCGLGGGDWGVILSGIEHINNIVICKLK